MSTVRPNAKLTIDNPDADGRIEKHGFGYDWEFSLQAQEDPLGAEEFVPTWYLSNTEIVPGLNLLGLRGYAVRGNMDLDDWTVAYGSGYWREETVQGKPAVRWLAWTDAQPNAYGSVISKDPMQPRLALWLLRFVPPPDQTYPVFVEVTLHGQSVAYTIQLPLHDETYKYPRLQRDIGSGDVLVDEWQRSDAQGLSLGNNVVYQYLWIEETDGVLIIRMAGVSEPWIYEPENEDYAPQYGCVSVTFRGHCGMFNLQPITYPASGTAKPSSYLTVPDWMNASDANYLAVASSRGAGVVTVDDDAASTWQHRPVVTLTRTDLHDRPLVYLVHQYHSASLSDARSSPVNTDTRKELLELSWTRRWPRDWEMEAILRDPDDYWATVVQNAKVQVQAGWDGSYSDIMTAYLDQPERQRDSELVQRAVLRGRDYLMARLAEKKFMAWPCSPEGWDLAAWVRWMLKRAGVPEALMDITSDGYVVPRIRRKRSQFQFSPDTSLLQAIDAVLATHEWVLGVKPDGTIWAGAEPSYSGTPDAMLDESTMTGDDLIMVAQAAGTGDDFRNYVAVFHGETLEGVVAADSDSMTDPSNSKFIGDDWWAVEVAPDMPTAVLRAQQLLARGLRRKTTLTWRTVGRADLHPGDFVEVNVSSLGIPSGSVFRIIEDRARIIGERLEWEHEFVAEAQS